MCGAVSCSPSTLKYIQNSKSVDYKTKTEIFLNVRAEALLVYAQNLINAFSYSTMKGLVLKKASEKDLRKRSSSMEVDDWILFVFHKILMPAYLHFIFYFFR